MIHGLGLGLLFIIVSGFLWWDTIFRSFSRLQL